MNHEDNVVEGDALAVAPSASAEERKSFRLAWWHLAFILPAIVLAIVFKAVLAFYLFYLLLVLTHELGHFIAGYFCGLRLIRFRVGILELRFPRIPDLQRPDQWEWKWNWGWFYAFSGYVAMVPTRKSMHSTRLRYFISTLAGPLTNLGTGLLALPIARADTGLGATGKFLVSGSIFLGVVNLFPFRKHGFESDGRRLWALLFDKNGAGSLYWLTFGERFAEIRFLADARRFEEAFARTHELLTEGKALIQTEWSTDLLLKLTNLRELYRKELPPELNQARDFDPGLPRR